MWGWCKENKARWIRGRMILFNFIYNFSLNIPPWFRTPVKVKDVAREYVHYFESILEMEIWNLKQAIIPLPKVTSFRNFSKRRKCHECSLGKCRRSGVQFRHRLAYLSLIEFYSFPFETLPNVEVKKKREEEIRGVKMDLHFLFEKDISPWNRPYLRHPNPTFQFTNVFMCISALCQSWTVSE